MATLPPGLYGGFSTAPTSAEMKAIVVRPDVVAAMDRSRDNEAVFVEGMAGEIVSLWPLDSELTKETLRDGWGFRVEEHDLRWPRRLVVRWKPDGSGEAVMVTRTPTKALA